MANLEHVEILKQGVDVWNRWRKENPDTMPDLSEENLYGSILLHINLSNADLHFANLSESCLSFANLTGADLRGTDLRRVDFSGAIFYKAALLFANLSSANLDTANFANANFGMTIIADVNLKNTNGLQEIQHWAPSTIGIDTLHKSNGEIPKSFLRRCGVPEDFIKSIPSLFTKPLYRCFISHSSKDQQFCNRLYNDLQGKGARCWYFPEDARWGRSVWGEIDQGIKIYDKLLVVCSKQSLQSGPVLREIERALQREDAEGKHILFPVYIDRFLFDEWDHPRKADVVAKVAGDFTGWKDPITYKTKLDRLLGDLKASEE